MVSLLFRHDAVEKLYRASGGIPRLVNILGNKALMLAFGRGRHSVDGELVNEAVADTEGVELPVVMSEKAGLLGIMLGVMIIAVSGFLIWRIGS